MPPLRKSLAENEANEEESRDGKKGEGEPFRLQPCLKVYPQASLRCASTPCGQGHGSVQHPHFVNDGSEQVDSLVRLTQ